MSNKEVSKIEYSDFRSEALDSDPDDVSESTIPFSSSRISKSVLSSNRLYQRLANQLERDIQTGKYNRHQPLPPERKLAASMGVSRVSIRRAIDELVQRGLVEKRKGSGTYIKQPILLPLYAVSGFSEDARSRGMVSDFIALQMEITRPTPEEAVSLGIAFDDSVSRLMLLRYGDQEPLVVQSTAIITEALPDPTMVTRSLYEVLESRGYRPTRAVQRISALALSEREAELLKVRPGEPGLRMVRVGYIDKDRPIEYTSSVYRGDRWDCVVELN